MKRIALPALLFALVLAGSAAAAPPPLPTGQQLGPPFRLPWPKAGQVEFVSVTVTGALKPGAKPTLSPIMYGRPPSNARVAGGKTKPVTKGGKTTVKFYFAIKNISTSRRLVRDSAPTPQADIFGVPTDWVDVNVAAPVLVTCLQIKAVLRHLAIMYSMYSFGDPPQEMWQGAMRYCG
jgi:hypothetical protein